MKKLTYCEDCKNFIPVNNTQHICDEFGGYAVMLSIKPKWCELIANGRKTIEVRKTRPKLETPFKCYIYCTKDSKGPDRLWVLNEQCRQKYDGLTTVCANLAKSESHHDGNGKVIGEFVCDMVEKLEEHIEEGGLYYTLKNDFNEAVMLDNWQLHDYGKGKPIYGWHISDLVIYDKPRELNEYKINRPPQSWCYIEEAA